MRILAIDPGVTTGMAVWNTALQQPEQRFELKTHDAVRDMLETLLDGEDYQIERIDCVVVESFVGAGYRTTEAINTIKLWGYIEYRYNATCQSPQQRKPYVARARELIPESIHAADALAHALAYAAKHP